MPLYRYGLNGMFALPLWLIDKLEWSLLWRVTVLAKSHCIGGTSIKRSILRLKSKLSRPTHSFVLHYRSVSAEEIFCLRLRVISPCDISRYLQCCPQGIGFSLIFETHNIQTQAFWRRVEPMETPPSLDEAAEEVRALLMRSVERRLMSDVPLGVFLSGWNRLQFCHCSHVPCSCC